MKRTSILKSLFGLIIVFHAFAIQTEAQTLKEVFAKEDTPITYFGIDFTLHKVIDTIVRNPTDIRDHQYESINKLIVDESKKYDLKKAFRKYKLTNDLSLVDSRNLKVQINDIQSTNEADLHRLKASDIETLVQEFDFGGKKGIGLLFVSEAMSKFAKKLSIWVTIIDINNKKVLMTERTEGKLGGFGFRNYVAAGIKEIIDQIEKNKYNEWDYKYNYQK